MTNDFPIPFTKVLITRFLFLLISMLLLFAACLLTSSLAHAAFLGHNFRGDYGLLSGTQPDPGLYLSALYLRYDADRLLNSHGDPIGPDPGQPGSIDINSYAASVWYVSDFKLLGANYGFILFPAFTNNALEAPIFGLDQSTNTGFTDLYSNLENPVLWAGSEFKGFAI